MPVDDSDRPDEAPPAACANCQTPLHGAYCAACGQRDEPLQQPLHRFLTEAVTEFFGLDGRLWRSLKGLLFFPGRLTLAYIQGHRVRYLRPLRLYLTASLLFFFLLAVSDPVATVDFGDDPPPSDSTLSVAAYRTALQARRDASNRRLMAQQSLVDSLGARVAADSLALANAPPADPAARQDRTAEMEDLIDEHDEERDDLQRMRRQHARLHQRVTWLEEQIGQAPADSLLLPARLEEAAELLFEDPPSDRLELNLPDWWPQSDAIRQMRTARTGEEMRDAFTSFFRDVLRRLPSVMFLLLPVFALLLKLVYIRRHWFYTEHLVFGLHTHAFAFTMFALMLLLSLSDASWTGIPRLLLLLAIPVYFVRAQKTVYAQGWFKTATKVLLFGGMYTFVLIGGLLLALALATAF